MKGMGVYGDSMYAAFSATPHLFARILLDGSSLLTYVMLPLGNIDIGTVLKASV